MCSINDKNHIAQNEQNSSHPTPPSCQVEAQQQKSTKPTIDTLVKGNGQIAFSLPTHRPKLTKAAKYLRKWEKRAKRRQDARDDEANRENEMANEALNSINFDQAGDFDPILNQQARPSPPTPAPIPTEPAAICVDDTSGSEYCYAGAGYGLR